MVFCGISIWGLVLVTALVAASLGMLYVIDRRMLSRSLRSLMALVVQMALAGLYVWVLYRLDNWFVNILWLLLMSAVVGYVSLDKVRLPWQKFLPVMFASVLAGCLALGGSLLLVLRQPSAQYLFVPVMGILLGDLLVSVTHALQTYIISLRSTVRHRLYMQGNGASHLEAVIPCVRRALRAALLPRFRQMSSPLLLALPVLACGMLMGGVPVGTAFVVALSVVLASYAATVLTTLLMLWLSDRYMFDGYGNFVSR